MLPWAHLCPNPKWHLHQFSRFCTAHGRESLDFTVGWAFFPLKLPFPIGGSELPSDTWFLGQPESLTQTTCRLVQPFLHSSSLCFTVGRPFLPQNCIFPLGIWTQSIHDSLGPSEPSMQMASQLVHSFLHSSSQSVTLYNGPPFPPNNCPFPWGIWTPSNTWFLVPTQVLNPNVILISWAVFAGLTAVTDRPIERPTDHVILSVTIGRIYMCSMAAWSNNNNHNCDNVYDAVIITIYFLI